MEDILYRIEKDNTRVVEKMAVRRLYEDLKEKIHLELIVSEGMDIRYFAQRDLHRPGLALAGFVKLFTHDKIQILGNTENYYLLSQDDSERHVALETIFEFEMPCIIVTNGNKIMPEMSALCEKKKVPLMVTELSTTDTIHLISNYLDEMFAPEMTMHGSMVDVYGIGMILMGKSGIGKSEIALDLVERGHRLVADDTIRISRTTGGILMARGHDTLKHFLEVRGVGILDVREMFGIRAVRVQKRVEVVVDLQLWDGKEEYERLGLDDHTVEYLGVKIPIVKLPIYPGKNITVIAEAIALNLLLKVYGYDAAKIFTDRLSEEIRNKNKNAKSYVTNKFLDGDKE